MLTPVDSLKNWVRELLISVADLSHFWKIKPKGVVHVGAHEAEEQDDYAIYGFGPVVWIEAQPELVNRLMEKVRPPSRVFQGLIWNESGKSMTLNVTNNGQSSSVFALGSHADSYPDIEVTSKLELTTSRLDSILPPGIKANFLNLDIQGAEYEALEGLGSLIENFDFIYSEVNRAAVYQGIKQVSQLDVFLRQAGFERIVTVWTKANWGDALYVRSSKVGGLFGGRWRLRSRQLVFTLLRTSRRSFLARKWRSLKSFGTRMFSLNRAR
jgi:FkbM family methyltransferase